MTLRDQQLMDGSEPMQTVLEGLIKSLNIFEYDADEDFSPDGYKTLYKGKPFFLNFSLTFLTFPLGFITKLTTSGMEAVIGSLFCFITDGSERAHNRSHRGGKMKFKSMFDVWLLSSKKERLEAIQSDYKLQYFGDSQVI